MAFEITVRNFTVEYYLRLLLLILWIGVGGSISYTQTPAIEFDNPPFEHPISQSRINSILQSKDGFIWFGTTDGLIKFDGYSYTSFIHNPLDTQSISNNWITEILEDKNHHLWIATDGGGVNEYLPQKNIFQHYRYQAGDNTSLSNDRVLVGAYGKNNTLWFGTELGGLNRLDLDSKEFTHFRRRPDEPNSLSDDRVWAVWEDTIHAQVWIGTRGGLDRLDQNTGSIIHYRHDPGNEFSLSNHFIMSIFQDSQKRMWVGTRGGLHQYDPVRDGFIRFLNEPENPHSLLNNFIFDVFEDSQHRIWIAADGGVSIWQEAEKNFVNYLADPKQKGTLNSGTVWKIYEDQEGRIWFATFGGGYSICHQFQRKIDNYSLPFARAESGAKNVIMDIIQTPDESIYIASLGGLHQFDLNKKTFQFFYPPWINPTDWQIWGMTMIEEKQLLLINTAGYIGFDLDTKQFSPNFFQGSAPRAIPTSITSDKSGNIWIFSNQTGELFKTNSTGEWTTFRPNSGDPNGLPYVAVNKLFMDSRNNLWLGTNGKGLLKHSSETDGFVRYTHKLEDPASLSSNFIYDIFEDRSKNIWIGTRDGGFNLLLSEEANGKFRHWIRNNSGTISDMIQGILEDEYGRLWMGTDRGLLRFNPREESFQNFGVRDGLYSYDFWGGPCLKTMEGALLFGSWNGLDLIYPERIRENPYEPKVVVTDFLLFDQSVPVRGTYGDTLKHPSPLQQHISYTEEIQLKWWQNDISFEFASLNYTLPEKNRYLYRLEGYQEEWIETAAGRRLAVYTNLDPGEYHFKVMGSNNDGIWNEQETHIKILIKSAWYATWWSYSLYGLAFISLVILYLRLQLKRRFAQLKADHLEQLDTAKTRVYTNISHEFRTPITIISGMAKQIRESPEKWFRDGLDMIENSARQLLNLVNQMLELRKLEVGSLETHFQQGNVFSFLHNLIEPFVWQAHAKNIDFHYLPGQKELWMDFDAEKLIRICSNLLSNAIKFTPEGGNIYFQVEGVEQEGSELLRIKVRDTGIGISPRQLPYIFDRFYQAEEEDSEQSERSGKGGTGIGLALTQELVKLLGGHISVQSRMGKGSEFTFTLPVHRDAPMLNQEETRSFSKVMTEAVPLPVKLGEEDEVGLDEKQDQLPIALLVEDHHDVVKYLTACLAEDYWIETAFNGTEGIARALELIPDIIISDVMMPGVDGLELCKKLKQDERTSHIPIILLTAKADRPSRMAGLEAGADSYLTKPFHRRELLLRMQNLLETRAQVRKYFLSDSTLPPESASDKENSEPLPKEDPFVQKLRKLIEDRMDDFDLKVQDLCALLNLSHSQLHRKLIAVTGLSPNRFIRQIRLERARQLLLDPSRSVTSIAFDTGFQDPDYFSRVFRQNFGRTPTDYRQANNISV